MSVIVKNKDNAGPMVALPGPHYRNNPHPKADFLLWRAPRSPWPMKETEKPKIKANADKGATEKLKKAEKVKMIAMLNEVKTSGVFHQGSVFSTPNANRGRHWSIHPEWPIEG